MRKSPILKPCFTLSTVIFVSIWGGPFSFGMNDIRNSFIIGSVQYVNSRLSPLRKLDACLVSVASPKLWMTSFFASGVFLACEKCFVVI